VTCRLRAPKAGGSFIGLGGRSLPKLNMVAVRLDRFARPKAASLPRLTSRTELASKAAALNHQLEVVRSEHGDAVIALADWQTSKGHIRT
jgi:hypothetical protein